MKKLLVILTVALLAASMGLSALAAGNVTLLDFSALTQAKVDAGDGKVTVEEGKVISYKTPGAPGYGYGSVAFTGGNMVVTLGEASGGTTINMLGLYGDFAANFKANYAANEYLGFYARTGADAVNVALYLFEQQVESAKRTYPTAASIIVYNMAGEVLEGLTIGSMAELALPADFEGYVYYKLDYANWDYPASWGHEKASFDSIACAALDIRAQNQNADATLTLGSLYLAKTGYTPEANPTPGPGATEKPSKPGDPSFITAGIAGVAAIIGLGGVAIFRRKK